MESLTPRAREVLTLVGKGLSNQDIPSALFVSEGTVKSHVGTILTQLGLNNRVQTDAWAHGEPDQACHIHRV